MGMYNEVYSKCPTCGGYGIFQVRQYVLGFGEFNLDDPTTLDRLSHSAREELMEEISGEYFFCGGCDNSFIPVK